MVGDCCAFPRRSHPCASDQFALTAVGGQGGVMILLLLAMAHQSRGLMRHRCPCRLHRMEASAERVQDGGGGQRDVYVADVRSMLHVSNCRRIGYNEKSSGLRNG